MRVDPARWLCELRRRRRAVLCAVLPALALSVASGPACAAMLAASATNASVVTDGGHDVHADHRHGAQAAHEPAAPGLPCPHCPLELGAANAGHAACVSLDANEDGTATPTGTASVCPPQIYLASWILPAARASPPLIGPAVTHDTPLGAAVSLNLRHCVLLI